MKGRLFSILMLFCLVVPIVTTIFVIHYQIGQVRKEVKQKIIAGIDKKELVFFKFSESEKSNLEWEHSKEFEYKGEFYDVVGTETNGDTTYYWCWWDYDETELNQQYFEMVTLALGNHPEKNEHQSRLFDYLESLYFADNSSAHAFASFHNESKWSCFVVNFYESMQDTPPFPPPELS